ncbi:MAG TPA: bifunctional oligoribonuclease/PAP phosphatase NrnA [Candidatus Limnocylindria bacterium]|nr:bifunctional oligoribonuclease/PAP phosphatase NrnA [Candidatus Limnocylindria bacterium]
MSAEPALPPGLTVVAPEPPAALVELLAGPRGSALMLGHVHPDGDVLGTLLGLGRAMENAGWTVTCGGPDPVPEVLDFLPGADRWQVWRTAPRTFDTIVLTDCPNDERTEGLLAGVRGPASRVLNIDHHPDNRRYGTLNWIDPSAAATGEMIFDLLTALGWPVGRDIALGLYTAIHTDTGSFRYSNTTPRTFRIAGALTAEGAEPALVTDRLYQRRPKDALLTLGRLLSRIEVSEDGRIAALTVPEGAASEAFMAAEDLVTYPRSIAGVKVAVLLRAEADGRVKASLRGKGDVPVNRIAHRFGGGGHENAAGCTLPGPLTTAKATLLAAVRQALDGQAS